MNYKNKVVPVVLSDSDEVSKKIHAGQGKAITPACTVKVGDFEISFSNEAEAFLIHTVLSGVPYAR